MPGRVVVRDGETIEQTLKRLRHAVRHSTRRQWDKSRPGCYVKKSDRRRNRESLRKRNAKHQTHGLANQPLTVFLTLKQLLARDDPFA